MGDSVESETPIPEGGTQCVPTVQTSEEEKVAREEEPPSAHSTASPDEAEAEEEHVGDSPEVAIADPTSPEVSEKPSLVDSKPLSE